MDSLALSSKMKRLTVWLDRNCQPEGFVQRCHGSAPFGRAYVTIDPSRQGQAASGNWNRIHLCGTEPGLTDEGLARLCEQFGIIGGYDLGACYPHLQDHMLTAVTEVNTRAGIDRLVMALRKALT